MQANSSLSKSHLSDSKKDTSSIQGHVSKQTVQIKNKLAKKKERSKSNKKKTSS